MAFQQYILHEYEQDSACFVCNICLEFARDPVITLCGHLYCWPCIYKCLDDRSKCPVCRAEVSQNTLVPLYGCGLFLSKSKRKPKHKGKKIIPPRPAACGIKGLSSNRFDTAAIACFQPIVVLLEEIKRSVRELHIAIAVTFVIAAVGCLVLVGKSGVMKSMCPSLKQKRDYFQNYPLACELVVFLFALIVKHLKGMLRSRQMSCVMFICYLAGCYISIKFSQHVGVSTVGRDVKGFSLGLLFF